MNSGTGENVEREISILWKSYIRKLIETRSLIKWYGRSKREYRITRFGNDFPFMDREYQGALIVLVREENSDTPRNPKGVSEEVFPDTSFQPETQYPVFLISLEFPPGHFLEKIPRGFPEWIPATKLLPGI